jgi:hypothetical protein
MLREGPRVRIRLPTGQSPVRTSSNQVSLGVDRRRAIVRPAWRRIARRGGVGAAGLGARLHPQLLAAQRRGCGARGRLAALPSAPRPRTGFHWKEDKVRPNQQFDQSPSGFRRDKRICPVDHPLSPAGLELWLDLNAPGHFLIMPVLRTAWRWIPVRSSRRWGWCRSGWGSERPATSRTTPRAPLRELSVPDQTRLSIAVD